MYFHKRWCSVKANDQTLVLRPLRCCKVPLLAEQRNMRNLLFITHVLVSVSPYNILFTIKTTCTLDFSGGIDPPAHQLSLLLSPPVVISQSKSGQVQLTRGEPSSHSFPFPFSFAKYQLGSRPTLIPLLTCPRILFKFILDDRCDIAQPATS